MATIITSAPSTTPTTSGHFLFAGASIGGQKYVRPLPLSGAGGRNATVRTLGGGALSLAPVPAAIRRADRKHLPRIGRAGGAIASAVRARPAASGMRGSGREAARPAA